MKNKIRRAFDATKPNVLNRVLEDCSGDDKSTPAAPQKKKKLSDRAMQFIATAASFAILISAAFGGFAYLRDRFDGQDRPGDKDQLSSRPNSFWGFLSPGQTDPTMDIEPVEPLPTVDYDSSEEGLVNRAMSIAIPPTQSYAPAYTFTEEGNEYVIRIPSHGIAYTFRFSTANGALLAIEVADDGTNSSTETSTITEAAAAWIALLDLDPEHYSITQHAEYSVSLLQGMVDYVDKPGGLVECYLVDVTHGGRFNYYVNVHTGEIMYVAEIEITTPVGIISPVEAQKIALADLELEQGRSECYLIGCELIGDYYCVTTCCTDDSPEGADMALITYRYYVDAYTGHITDICKGLSQWSEAMAVKVAGAYADEMTGGNYAVLDCEYIFRSGLISYYKVSLELMVPGGNQTVTIQVYELYGTDGPEVEISPPVDYASGMIKARDIALGMLGISLDDVIHLEVSLDGYPYRVYFETKDLGYKYFLDQDGNVTYDAGTVDVIRPAENTAVTWKEARDLCLEACGRSLEELIFFGYEYRSEGHYYMEMGFPDDSFVWFIDGQTGDFLDEPIVDILPPVVEGMITYEQAWEIAVHHTDCLEESLAGALTGTSNKLDASSGIFTVSFQNGDGWWEIEIDAYTGDVLIATNQTITVPDGNIGQDQAVLAAVTYAGCVKAYEDGTLGEVAIKFDEDKGAYWVYFTHEGIYWEIEVGAYNAAVYNAQCWEQDVAVDYPCIDYEYELKIGDQTVLLMVTPGEVIRYSLLNAETGERIDGPVPPGSQAMQIVAEYLGLETFTSGSLALRGQLENGKYFDCVVIPMEGFSYVVLMDPDTKDIFYQDTIAP